MRNLFLLLFTIITLTSCETKNRCEDVLCSSPIPFVSLNIINSESGKNLFVNRIYTIEDVTLLNENNESIPIQLDLDYNLISAIGDIAGNNKYRLLLSPELEILITTQVSLNEGSCCSTSSLENFKVLNFDFEETDIRNFTIFIK